MARFDPFSALTGQGRDDRDLCADAGGGSRWPLAVPIGPVVALGIAVAAWPRSGGAAAEGGVGWNAGPACVVVGRSIERGTQPCPSLRTLRAAWAWRCPLSASC